MTDLDPQSVLSERDQLQEEFARRLVDAREQTAEGLRIHSINIMQLNEARQGRDTPAAVIAERAAKMRTHEKLVEKFIGEETEAWMNYYAVFGIPGEPAQQDHATQARDWVRPLRLPDGQ